MNIFMLDKDPELCARYHCDSHVIKMILESAQLLSTAVRSTGVAIGYKATHINHPCSIWARKSLDNWLWLREIAFYLNAEYRYRYSSNKAHKSINVILELPEPKLPLIGRTAPAQAMPDKYKQPDFVRAYRDYYINEKRALLTYTKRGKPVWLK